MKPASYKAPRHVNSLAYANMVRAFVDGPHTVHDVAEITGFSLFTARHHTLSLYSRGAVHIAHWEQDSRGRYCTPAYAIGNKKDAIKPKVTNSQRGKAYRGRQETQRIIAALRGEVTA